MLTWREELAVGHPEIDADHKRLIALINDFEAMIAKGSNERTLHEVLIGLHDYARSHFQREEAVQIACRYPHYAGHKAEHQALLDDVTAMARRYFIDRSAPITRDSLDEASALLRHWLVDHIVKSDLRIRQYLPK
jgi:hemerythrin